MELVKLNLDLAKVNADAQEKATRLNALAVTKSNCLNLEELRTEANKEIKGYKAQIEAAKKEYLKPFEEAEKAALDAIQPYEEAAKRLSASILEAKKGRKEDELRGFYLLKTAPNADGEIPFPFAPSFEQCVEGLPASVSLTQAKETIEARLINSNPVEKTYTFKGSKNAIDKVLSLAKGLGVEWEELF